MRDSSLAESHWPLHIFDINCTGEESTVWDCPHNALFGFDSCDHKQDALIQCQISMFANTFIDFMK